MTIEEFKKNAHQIVDWMADYYQTIEKYPVKAPVKSGQIISQLPCQPPENPEPFNNIFSDLEII